MENLVQVPKEMYSILGILVVANIGTIIAMVGFIFKCGVFVANTNAGIKDAKNSAVRAHKRIDDILINQE